MPVIAKRRQGTIAAPNTSTSGSPRGMKRPSLFQRTMTRLARALAPRDLGSAVVQRQLTCATAGYGGINATDVQSAQLVADIELGGLQHQRLRPRDAATAPGSLGAEDGVRTRLRSSVTLSSSPPRIS